LSHNQAPTYGLPHCYGRSIRVKFGVDWNCEANLLGIHNRPPDNIEQLTARNISTDCPSCGDTVALIPWHHPSNTHDESYFVALCPNQRRNHCKPIFAVYQPLNDRIIDRYPTPSFKASSLHEAIPMNIREDFAEAKRCLSVPAYKASVAMCRRVVEALACEKLGRTAKREDGKTMKLYQLIDTMHADGLITKNIKETAQELRHFGTSAIMVHIYKMMAWTK